MLCAISSNRIIMEDKSYLGEIDGDLLKVIEQDLNEDPERLENQVRLFKEWLRCEPHLPKDIDNHLIINFVRLSKCDLEKAKKKFENYLAFHVKMRRTPAGYITLDEKYFAAYDVHRQYSFHPKLTPQGYRVCFYRLPVIDKFDFDQITHYGITVLGVMLFEDTCSGTVIVYDFKHFTTHHLAKINLKSLLTSIDLLYNVSPIRIKNIHVLNLPKVAETILNVALKTMNEKVSKRLICHQSHKDLAKFLPADILPEEYGGTGGDLDKYGDQLRAFLVNNENFAGKISSLKLTGPIPSNKNSTYSFEEFGSEGSFRKLNID